MIKYRQALCVLLLTLLSGLASAQSGYPTPSTNSPYTRYGYGMLSDQSFGNSRAMGGIAYGLRNGAQINPTNPASYSAIDSMTFLFDGGFSMQNDYMSDGNIKKNVKNSTFDYIAMQFRLYKRLGMSVGFLPFSNVGYSMSSTSEITDAVTGERTTVNQTYSGNGGLHQLYAGLGFKVLENLSVGVNASYLFGNITHTSSRSFNLNGAYFSNKINDITVRDYKLDFGLQYTQHFGKKHAVTLGAVYSLKHTLHSEAYNYTQLGQTTGTGSPIIGQEADTISSKGFGFPHFFGGGFTYVYDRRLTIGFDYTYQKWAGVKFNNEDNHFSNRTKYAFGLEYLPSYTTRKYLGKMRYRAGAYYSDPYIKVKGEDGAREYGVSLGVGLPVFNSKSIVNVSAQYIQISPRVKGMLKEQYLKINVGLTFNERWFMKWKVE